MQNLQLDAGAAPLELAARVIDSLKTEVAGSSLVVTAGIHGNEPAGIIAAERVFARLRAEKLICKGEFIAFRGNLRALAEQQRYIHRDLNRVWLETSTVDDHETSERAELNAEIEKVVARKRGQVVVLDLHTSSAPGVPFAVFGDTLAQREFASVIPIPAVLGLDEEIDGALCQYWAQRGCLCLAVEGGQHVADDAVASHMAVIVLCLQRAGLLDARANAWAAECAAELDERRSGLPRLLEVLARHPITDADQFRMALGFRNIDKASRGQLLANDRYGEIRARSDGLVVLPLYQGSGQDGYFWGREISPLRQKLQSLLRRLLPAQLLALLPGVRPVTAGLPGFVLAHASAADARLGLLRALGYRRIRPSGEGLFVQRSS